MDGPEQTLPGPARPTLLRGPQCPAEVALGAGSPSHQQVFIERLTGGVWTLRTQQ